MSISKEQEQIYRDELNKVNKELNKLSDLLKDTLDTTPIELINLYEFISLVDTLNTKKQKLIYILAVNTI